MSLPYTLTNGTLPDADQVMANFNYLRNIFHHGGNIAVGQTGTIYCPVVIQNTSNTPEVYLYLLGKKRGTASGLSNHGGGDSHYHGMSTADNQFDALAAGPPPTYLFGFTGASWATNPVALGAADRIEVGILNNTIVDTNVPKFVQIWIDGSQYTATIGDPNTKGVSMYSAGNGWGADGTTEWDTGRLNLSSLITWSTGLHYIELKETGGIGGTLIYHVSVNGGF